MKRFTTMLIVGGVTFIAGATGVLASEASGLNVVIPEPTETTDLGNGLVYESVASKQVCVTTDPNHPLNRASGDCAGGCVRKGDGEPTCMGSCTWVDAEGDLAFFTWTGQSQGSWSMQGGTGKYANASGNGTWMVSAVYAGGAGANSWKGSIEME